MYLSERAAKKARQSFFNKIVVIFCAVLLLATILALFSRSSFAFAKMTVSGNTATEKTIPEKSINTVTDHDLLFFFKRNNILFFPANRVKREMMAAFPRIKEIKIKRKDFKEIEIAVFERRGDYLWCQSQEKCFLIDDTGFIYAPAPYLIGNAFLRFYGGGELAVGEAFLPEAEFNRLLLLKEKLDTTPLAPRNIELRENEYDLILVDGGKIIISRKNDFEAAFNSLISAMAAAPLDKKLKEEMDKLEYLDLRFKDRVVYKFK